MKAEEFRRRLIDLTLIERKAQIDAMLSEIKRLSGLERERKGRAILNLRGKVVGEEFGFKLVRFGRKKPFETEISVGDEVFISKGNPLKSNLTGVVTEKGARFITVALENLPEWALKDVRIDLYASDLTFRRWVENLQNADLRVLKLALGEERPSEPHFVEFEPYDTALNESQKKAVSGALGSDDFFLIHGPFGTGKTRTVVELIRQLVRRGEKVLVTAESNIAVDNLVELLSDMKIVRLGHPSRISEKLKKFSISALLESHADYELVRELREKVDRLREEMSSFLKPVPSVRRGLDDDEILKLAEIGKGTRGVSAEKIRSMARWIKARREVDELLEKIRSEEERILKEIVEESDVVLATNSSAFLLEKSFDVAVVDEASQATIPSVLIPIERAKRFVLAGDHKQLPPTVLEARELSRTLFEMLIELYPSHSQLLNVQYRMNEVIMEFPNREFYGGKIVAHESVRNLSLNVRSDCDLGSKPVVFVDTARCPDKWEKRLPGSTSIYNELECRIVEQIVMELLKSVKKEWIGVITPYDDQVDKLRRVLDVEVSTVDGYQGREKEVVVISFVRSNSRREIGFLEDLRRLNVSLTRARRKLIMVGDSSTLSANETYRRLIEFVKKRGTYVTLKPPCRAFQTSRAQAAPGPSR